MMKNEMGSSRMDTILKMLMIAFISLLAFSTGVYFGKKLSDSDYQLKALESDFNHGSSLAKGDSENPETAIAEEEVNALSEKLVNSEKTEMGAAGAAQDASHKAEEGRKVASNDDGHGAAAAPSVGHDAHHEDAHAAPAAATGHDTHDNHDTHDSHAPAAAAQAQPRPAQPAHGAPAAAHHSPQAANGKPDLSAAAKAAQRIAQNAAPVEANKPVAEIRVPSSLPKTVGTSQDVEFTVQVASYPTAEAAKDHANELVKKGFPAFPVEATVSGRTWYRVSIGSFRTQKEATLYRAQLLKQTALPSAIVQKISR